MPTFTLFELGDTGGVPSNAIALDDGTVVTLDDGTIVTEE